MRVLLIAAAWALAVYFTVYILGTLAMTAMAAMVTRRRQHELLPSTLRRVMRAEMTPSISVCIAAYNESSVIVDTVRSVLALDYPQVEVVLANDGSTDSTMDVLLAEFDLRRSERRPLGELPHAPILGLYEPRAAIPLLVVDKKNGGRSDALNAAIVHARGPLVAVMDADELVANDTLARVIGPFLADPVNTVAAGASLGVANGCRVVRGRIIERRRPRQVLPLFQAIEYDRSFRISRTAAGLLRALPVISGGFGLFRRDILIDVGGYAGDTIGEDFEITLRIHRYFADLGIPTASPRSRTWSAGRWCPRAGACCGGSGCVGSVGCFRCCRNTAEWRSDDATGRSAPSPFPGRRHTTCSTHCSSCSASSSRASSLPSA